MRRRLVRSVFGSSIVLALVLLALTLVPGAHAFDGRAAEEIVIPAGAVIDDDLYIAGKDITISGTVRGDVMAAGQIVRVNGTIEGSLFAAGQTVIVNGSVRDSARLAGQAILIGQNARIGRDVLAGAYSFETHSESTIGRDVMLGAYQGLLAGRIQRDLKAGLGALEIRGTVGRNVELAIGGSSTGGTTAGADASPPPEITLPVVRPGLTVAPNARIEGHLTYSSPIEYPIAGQVAQGVTWDQREEEPAGDTASNPVVDAVRQLIAVGLIGLLLLWLAPRALPTLAETIRSRPGPSVGWGIVASVCAFIGFFAIGLVALILALGFGALTLSTLAGLVVVLGLLVNAALVVGLVVFTGLIGQAIASYLSGKLILERLQPDAAGGRIAPFLAGLPIVVILLHVPVLGGMLGLAIAFVALGALWLVIGDRKASPPPPPREESVLVPATPV